MSMIPDCRPKYEKDTAYVQLTHKDAVKPDEINPYWSGLLRGHDRDFLDGYDWNTEFSVNGLFDNLDAYDEEFRRIGLNTSDMDASIVNGAVSEGTFAGGGDEKWLSDFSDKELHDMSMTTKVCLLMKEMLNGYIEEQRDMLVTSMIESMDEKEYGEAMEDAKGHGKKDGKEEG